MDAAAANAAAAATEATNADRAFLPPADHQNHLAAFDLTSRERLPNSPYQPSPTG